MQNMRHLRVGSGIGPRRLRRAMLKRWAWHSTDGFTPDSQLLHRHPNFFHWFASIDGNLPPGVVRHYPKERSLVLSNKFAAYWILAFLLKNFKKAVSQILNSHETLALLHPLPNLVGKIRHKQDLTK